MADAQAQAPNQACKACRPELSALPGGLLPTLGLGRESFAAITHESRRKPVPAVHVNRRYRPNVELASTQPR